MLKDTSSIFLFHFLRPSHTILRLVRASPHGDLWTVGGLDIHSQVMLWATPEIISQGPDGEVCREGKKCRIGAERSFSLLSTSLSRSTHVYAAERNNVRTVLNHIMPM